MILDGVALKAGWRCNRRPVPSELISEPDHIIDEYKSPTHKPKTPIKRLASEMDAMDTGDVSGERDLNAYHTCSICWTVLPPSKRFYG